MFDTFQTLDCGGRPLALDRPRIMGIVNVTPDSFSDGGALGSVEAAISHALELAAQGADIVDIGGESTRPGATPVSVEEELRRVIPVIEGLRERSPLPISIDTSKPEVMRAAVAAGAGMINDIHALGREGAMDAAAMLGVPVCLMHMQGEPATMQDDPRYDDVVAEVHAFFTQRLFACQMAGIDRKKIIVDPGFGFGKTLEHNLRLLRQLSRLVELGVPVLAGLSRKGMIGTITGREMDDRVVGSAVAAVIAIQNGAAIVRVHDVGATRDALKIWEAVAKQPGLSKRPASPEMPRWGDED